MNLATAKQILTAKQHAERVAAILESNDAQVIATARHNGEVIGAVARFPTGRPRVILSCSEYNRRVRILAAKLPVACTGVGVPLVDYACDFVLECAGLLN